MLFEDGGVLDGHAPAAEVDHSPAECLVTRQERRRALGLLATHDRQSLALPDQPLRHVDDLAAAAAVALAGKAFAYLFVSDEPCAIHDRCAGVVLAGNQTYLPALAFDPFTAQLPGSTQPGQAIPAGGDCPNLGFEIPPPGNGHLHEAYPPLQGVGSNASR
jgi:hypothetical protein